MGSQIFIGSPQPGVLIPQIGGGFPVTEWGFDAGVRKYTTHPNTPSSSYPQRNQRDSVYAAMFVRNVVPTVNECGMIDLSVHLKGLISVAGPQNKPRLLPGADSQLFSIPALSSGKSISLIAPVPKDTCTYEYVTTSQPSLQGVGAAVSLPFLPTPASFSISYVPDPSAGPLPQNYFVGWVLDDRSWEDVADSVFLVRERYGFYYTLAA